MCKRAQHQIPHLHATRRHLGDVLTYLQPLPRPHVRTQAKNVFRNHGPGYQRYSYSNNETMVPGYRIDSLYPVSEDTPATVTCSYIVDWHRWILDWGNVVHDTTTTMPGPCSEKSASPREGSGHSTSATGVPWGTHGPGGVRSP
jgi:hypothetical protein